MQPIQNLFFIRANPDLHKTLSIKSHDGRNLILDTDFQKYNYATQIGEIAYAPLCISDEYTNDNPVKVKDTVVFHHFVCQPDNEFISNGERVYKCEYFHLFAKIENEKLTALEDFIFVQPILESEDSIWSLCKKIQLKPRRENLKYQAIVFSLSKQAEESGLLEGDKVYFTKDADYDINLFGIDLWRMRVRNIVAVERNGQLICLNDKIMVKCISDQDAWVNTGSVIMKPEDTKEKRGVIIGIGSGVSGLNTGLLISYFNSVGTKLKFGKETFAFIGKSNISFIIE